MRQEIADLHHALKTTKVSLQILEEKYQNQDNLLIGFTNKKPQFDQITTHLARLEKKIAQIENFQEKLVTDLRHLSSDQQEHFMKMQDCEKSLDVQKTRIDEIAKLKTTLNSITQAIQHKSNPSGYKKHKVKAGDTLEKIAKQYHVTLTSLKKQNKLHSDHIQIGQEIEVPDE